MKLIKENVKYGLIFLIIGLFSSTIVFLLDGILWINIYIGFSFLLVGLAYMGVGVKVLGKKSNGQISLISKILLLPFFLFIWGFWHLIRVLQSEPPYNQLTPSIIIGRRLLPHEYPKEVTSILDLTCEFQEPRIMVNSLNYSCLPILDASIPNPEKFLEMLLRVLSVGGNLYIHCAVGHGRTGMASSLLLLINGDEDDLESAIKRVQKSRPKVKLTLAQKQVVQQAYNIFKESKNNAPNFVCNI